jgi:hypothetical protein
MNRMLASGVALLFCAGALAQTGANSQVNASASQGTSVSASRAGAQAQSNTSANASQQTPLSNEGGSSPAATTDSELASGTDIHVALTKPLDAKKNREGDRVFAKTTKEVRSANGVVIPKGSRVLGRVTQAKTRAKGENESALGIAFEKAVLKDGREVPMNAVVQAVAAAQSQAAFDAGGSDVMTSGSAMGSEAVRGGSGGLLGGVGGTAGALTSTTAGIGSAVGGSVASGASATGSLASNASGVIGMPGMALNAANSTATNASVISSSIQNVHLQSGTQMLLRVVSR